MTAEHPADQGGDKAAELRAAVRAVESGERSATDFFTAPAPPPPAPRRGTDGGGPTSGRARTAAAEGSGVPVPGPGVAVPGELSEVLAAGGAPQPLAAPLTEALGPQAAETLREDPWTLLAAPGVRPEQADGFARALLGAECTPEDERRISALTVWLLESAGRRGHTVQDPDTLCRQLAQYAVPDPRTALESAVDSGAVLRFEDPAPGAEPDEEGRVPAVVTVGLDRYAVAEEGLADGLERLRTAFSAPDDAGPWQEAAGATTSPSAAELIRAAAGAGVVLHSGGESSRAEAAELLAAGRGLGLRVRGVAQVAAGAPAPGSAEDAGGGGEDGGSGRPGLSAGADASPGAEEGVSALRTETPAPTEAPRRPTADGPGTLAGLLATGPRDDEGLLALDLLVVLDAPSLTAETAAVVAESLPDGARLVLSGDPGVLGPPGAGRPVAELLSSGEWPVVVSRTPEPGPVGELVGHVAIGELPTVEAPGKELVVVPVQDPREAVHRAVQLVSESIPRAFGHRDGDVVVLTVGHGGAVGSRALNAALKERLNPGPGRYAGFDPGDRITWSPVPGRVHCGRVVEPVAPDGLVVECEGERSTVRPEAGALRHGWALTAHQAAGRQWPAVVAVVPGDAAEVLDRAWVYTAFSRARHHLSVVQGAGAQLARAVAAVPPAPSTRLGPLLRQARATQQSAALEG